MLDLDRIDVDEIATALADQTAYEHRWLIDPRRGEAVFRTSDTGIDDEHPVDLDELDLILVDPLPSYVWYQDMVDFAEGVSDRAAGRGPSRSLNGKGAFRRFRDELYDRHPGLISACQSFRVARARAPAIRWLVEQDCSKRPSDNSRATIRSIYVLHLPSDPPGQTSSRG